MVTALRIVGQSLGGLGLIAYGIGWAGWYWLTGAVWFPERASRRYVTRPVRATLQCGLTAVMLGVVVAPAVTGWTLAALVTSVVVAAAGWRLRQRLDHRVVVKVGHPIPNRPARRGRGTWSRLGERRRPPGPRGRAAGRLPDLHDHPEREES